MFHQIWSIAIGWNKVTLLLSLYHKFWRLGKMSLVNAITFILFPMCIFTIFFAIHLGHCSSCVKLLHMTNSYQLIRHQIPQELHCWTSNEYIYNMYIIHIPELDFPVFSFLRNTFVVPFQYFLSMKNNSTSQVVPQAPCPRRVSHVLAPLDLHFEVDCFMHYHQMTSVLRISLSAIF